MTLARSVWSSSRGVRQALLTAGTPLTEGYRRGLERAGVWAVYVDDGFSSGVEPPEVITPETRERAMQAVGSVYHRAAQCGGHTRVGADEVAALDRMVAQVMHEIAQSGRLVWCLDDLGAFDRYTLRHSVNVLVLGLMVGREALTTLGWSDWRGDVRYDNVEERLRRMGLGLLLHDVGKILIPEPILKKPGRLSADEMDIVRQHPQAGVDMVDGDALGALSRVVIAGHHERIDGSGYPAGRSGDAVHVHAQIAGMADVYDAVSSTRVYQARRPTQEAWELVLSMSGSGFGQPLVEAFKRSVAPYPEGVAVLVSDGRRALVVRNDREHTSRPLIRVTHDREGRALADPEELALFDHPSITILDTLADLEGDAGWAGDRDEQRGFADDLAGELRTHEGIERAETAA
jgi:HD-GYP domain-containing protein (c-di-GMP phosphodiesterase class II)